MQNVKYLILSLLQVSALLVSAAPSADSVSVQSPECRSFKVPRYRNEEYARNGAAARARVFRKYGWPDNLLSSEYAEGSVPQTGEVTATPEQYHSEYLSPVTIGGQTLNMDFDTGSADLWVFSSYLSQNDSQGHNIFDPNMSTTYQPLPREKWSISYGDGTGAAGLVGTDTVNIGGATVSSQAVELATAVSEKFVLDTNNDGLVGLAFSILNEVTPDQQTTFFQNVMPSLENPVFTVDLQEDGNGTYEFGFIDSSKYSGTLASITIDADNGFWQFNSPSFYVDGTKYMHNGAPVIADTGTSLLILDRAIVNRYYSFVPYSTNSKRWGGFVFPCTTTLPPFSLTLGSNKYVVQIPGSMINYAPVQPGSSTCYGGIQSNQGMDLQVFGDFLFRNAFVVFTGGKAPTLRIADKA